MTVLSDESVTLIPVVVSTNQDDAQSVDSACIALRILTEYATLTGLGKTSSVHELLVDLIADLKHLADQQGIAFDVLLQQAEHITETENLY